MAKLRRVRRVRAAASRDDRGAATACRTLTVRVAARLCRCPCRTWSWSTTTTPTRGTSCTSSPRSPACCRRRPARRGRTPRVLGHSHVVLSPGPGHPADPADFAVGREVLLAGTAPGARRLPGHAGPGDGVRRHGRARRARARRRGGGDHDGRGVFAGLPQDFAAVRYHSLAALARARRAGGDGARRRRRGDGRAPPVAAARGRAVPPRVDPVRARRRAGRELPGADR